MESTTITAVAGVVVVSALALGAFLVFLGTSRRSTAAGTSGFEPAKDAPPSTQWYEFLLAGGLVVALALVVAFLLLGVMGDPGPSASGWREDARADAFLTVMLLGLGIAAVAFVIFLLTRIPRKAGAVGGSGPVDPASAVAPVESPALGRLAGLALLGVLLLLLAWIYLPNAAEFSLMLTLLYPGTLAVALVLLADKATRGWSIKGRHDTFREWLYCDVLVIMLILGFFNLQSLPNPENYRALFWDLLYLGLFFLVFWLLDRQSTRYRFLVAQGYLVVAALLLLIWRATEAIVVPEGLSWWGSVWPATLLSLLFFVLEIVALVALGGERRDSHPVQSVKDVVFFVLFSFTLALAIPSATG